MPVEAPVESAEVARKQSNLAFTFLSLEPERRRAMEVFYDFCRAVDDIADDPQKPDATKQAELDTWRQDIAAIYAGQTGRLSVAQELAPLVPKYGLREADLRAVVDGVAMDVGGARFETFADLRRYCYGVASAVGLSCVRIFGCTHPDTDAYAETLGYALQFTNILRDVVEDYREMGRVYLPQAEMRAFGLNEDDLHDPSANADAKRLFQLCHYRCKHYFHRARRLLPASERQNLKAALVMAAFYEDILDKIAANDFRIGPERTRLNKRRKFQLLWRTMRELKKPLSPRAQPGRTVVLGGGVAGITAALEAGYRGETPVLCEAKAFLGGRAHSLTDAQTGLTLDNGQHIVMGCYEAFWRMVERLHIGHKFERQETMAVPYASPGGRWSKLTTQRLPAPFHLLGGLFSFAELSHRDRLAILRMGAMLKMGATPDAGETAEAWLQRSGQTPGACRALWEPFCVAALNEPLPTASAKLLHECLRRSVLGSSRAAAIHLAKVGLTELFEPEARLYLEAIGGELRTGCKASTILAEGDRARAVQTSKGESIAGDRFIAALPHRALAGLLPEESRVKEFAAELQSSAIISVHLLCDRPLFRNGESFVGLLDSPVHWVFDRTKTLPLAKDGLHLYAVIISAANEWNDRSSAEIEQTLRGELARFFPEAAGASFERTLVYKSRDATFAARPEVDAARPGVDAAPWKNVALAGDWVQTQLPGTLEGAAQSGFTAVDALLGTRA